MNQTSEPKAQELVLTQLLNADLATLVDVLSDQVRGLALIQKLINCPALTEKQRHDLKHQVIIELEKLGGPGHKKLLGQLLEN